MILFYRIVYICTMQIFFCVDCCRSLLNCNFWLKDFCLLCLGCCGLLLFCVWLRRKIEFYEFIVDVECGCGMLWIWVGRILFWKYYGEVEVMKFITFQRTTALFLWFNLYLDFVEDMVVLCLWLWNCYAFYFVTLVVNLYVIRIKLEIWNNNGSGIWF